MAGLLLYPGEKCHCCCSFAIMWDIMTARLLQGENRDQGSKLLLHYYAGEHLWLFSSVHFQMLLRRRAAHCCTPNQTKWIMAKWADIITAHDRNLRNGCLHVELESIENESIWTDTFNCNTIHILVSLSLVNWTVGQVSFDGLVSPSISIICFTEEGK